MRRWREPAATWLGYDRGGRVHEVRHDGVGSGSAHILLQQAALFAHYRIGVKKNFHVRRREDFGADVAAFHDHATAAPISCWRATIHWRTAGMD